MTSGKPRAFLTSLLILACPCVLAQATDGSDTRGILPRHDGPSLLAPDEFQACPSAAGAGQAQCGSTQAKPSIEALIASLAQPAPAHTAFTEVRFMSMLDAPMVVSGKLSWLGDDHLQRRVESPFVEVTDIADGEVTTQRAGESAQHFSLQRSAQLQGLLGSFQALLSGDSAAMMETFKVTMQGDATQWKLILDPRDARVKQRLVGLVVYGADAQARCLRMDEPDGDVSITLLGDLAAAALPVQPKPAALIERCSDSDANSMP